jgi:hypothetical protein
MINVLYSEGLLGYPLLLFISLVTLLCDPASGNAAAVGCSTSMIQPCWTKATVLMFIRGTCSFAGHILDGMQGVSPMSLLCARAHIHQALCLLSGACFAHTIVTSQHNEVLECTWLRKP